MIKNQQVYFIKGFKKIIELSPLLANVYKRPHMVMAFVEPIILKPMQLTRECKKCNSTLMRESKIEQFIRKCCPCVGNTNIYYTKYTRLIFKSKYAYTLLYFPTCFHQSLEFNISISSTSHSILQNNQPYYLITLKSEVEIVLRKL